MSKKILIFIILIANCPLLFAQKWNSFSEKVSVSSPDNSKNLTIKKIDNKLIFNICDKIDTLIFDSNLELAFKKKDVKDSISTNQAKRILYQKSSFSSKIINPFGENYKTIDKYNCLKLKFDFDELELFCDIRLYNEGFAYRFSYNSIKEICISRDFTNFDIKKHNVIGYFLPRNENNYFKITINKYSKFSILPFTCVGKNWSFCFNEANNRAITNRASMGFDNLLVYFYCNNYKFDTNCQLPWRYVVWGKTPLQMLEGKYIIHSLNNQNKNNYNWIKPGKVFRSMELNTQSIKQDIDFVKQLNFSYILLDAGWYGYGYNTENSVHSSPFESIKEIDIKECVNYAKKNGMGIILYVNRAAFEVYDYKKILDKYSEWGVSGIKMGFMEGKTVRGLNLIYSIVEYGLDKHLIFNVHDNFYPTGYELMLPNLLTAEAIRGNEYEHNSTTHNTILPFTRFMTGASDYTFCVKGDIDDSPTNRKIYSNVQSKVMQMALATIYFSPLQHILWYGRPQWYKDLMDELEYYKELPTVWEKTVYLSGEPGEYFAIARKSKNRWFVAISNNERQRTVEIDLNFLKMNYKSSVFYSDDNLKVVKDSSKIVDFNMKFNLKRNCGIVGIIDVKK